MFVHGYMKPARATVSLLALLVASACASSQAEPNRPAATPPAPVASPSYDGTNQPVSRAVPGWPEAPPNYSPYGVELLSGDFRSLPTFYSSGRAYVMGSIGERYRIRITNPTARRVEAMVSVDGLDAIDGKTASYEDKRGYIILPTASVTIEGFRTSLDQVATFRFSSVRDSYAGRKGQDRNVGVIGVAFFPERDASRFALPPRPIVSDDRARGSAESAPPAKASAYGDDAERRAPADASAAPAPSGAKGRGAGGYAPRRSRPPPNRARAGHRVRRATVLDRRLHELPAREPQPSRQDRASFATTIAKGSWPSGSRWTGSRRRDDFPTRDRRSVSQKPLRRAPPALNTALLPRKAVHTGIRSGRTLTLPELMTGREDPPTKTETSPPPRPVWFGRGAPKRSSPSPGQLRSSAKIWWVCSKKTTASGASSPSISPRPAPPGNKTRAYEVDLTQPIAEERISRDSLGRARRHPGSPGLPRLAHPRAAGRTSSNRSAPCASQRRAAGSVRKLVMWSQTLLYGAHPTNPNFLSERHPLRAPQRRAVLRRQDRSRGRGQPLRAAHRQLWSPSCAPRRSWGRRCSNYLSKYLARRLVPTMMGFDPLWQFLHEADAIAAFKLAIFRDVPGTFNIVGDGVLPSSTVIKLAGRVALPVPHPLFPPMVGALWLAQLSEAPPAFLDYLRYICVADGEKAAVEMGFRAAYTTREALIDYTSAQRLRDVRLLHETPA